MIIDIKGLDKAELLRALYNRSKQQGMGFMHAEGQLAMSIGEAREVIADYGNRLYFDYLNGRVMKVDITKDEMLADLYDRDIGYGAAKEVVEKLRNEQT